MHSQDVTPHHFLVKQRNLHGALGVHILKLTLHFYHMVDHPYNEISVTSSSFLLLERFTVLLYDQSSNLTSVNEARLDLFCKKKEDSGKLASYPGTFV